MFRFNRWKYDSAKKGVFKPSQGLEIQRISDKFPSIASINIVIRANKSENNSATHLSGPVILTLIL